jgi:secreted trypsin-like serine protease
MGRRVSLTVIVAVLALMMALAGGPAALAATKRLPIKSGPHGVSRASGEITPKIVGGRPVPNGKYKFQAALLAQPFGSNDFERQYCGGSLITPFEVLTAAHCVDFVGSEPGQLPLSDLRVVVGRTVLTSTQGQKRRVAGISVHPQWDPVAFSLDAAVLHLASPINGIAPIMLVTPGVDALERPGTLATVTGWGNTIQQPAGPGGGGVSYPNRMQEAQVPITSRAECRTAYAAAGANIDATICAPAGPTSTPARATAAARCSSGPPAPATSRPVSPAGASAAARPASPGSTPASATGGWGTSSSRSQGAYR